ncbi:MAG: hypothetical protein IPN02_10055 [Candidatus Microthrix sp.]|uniref:Uncharacterized protein n=1 Tax=Candidatus Neomicrothrix subdominans TaxID=2954438 RepID=A0A936NDR6_9ACTN|nr:hypothetical protein [Candidatus Microthrix subdominans]
MDDETTALVDTLRAACRVAPDSFSSVRAMAEEGEESFSGATKYIVDRSSRSTAGSWWGADDGPDTSVSAAMAAQAAPAMASSMPAPVAPGGPTPAPAPSVSAGLKQMSASAAAPSSGDTKLRVLAIVSFLLGIIVMTIAVVLVVSG